MFNNQPNYIELKDEIAGKKDITDIKVVAKGKNLVESEVKSEEPKRKNKEARVKDMLMGGDPFSDDESDSLDNSFN